MVLIDHVVDENVHPLPLLDHNTLAFFNGTLLYTDPGARLGIV